MIKALKAAFPATIPVLLGYLFVGMAFGILVENIGLDYFWAGFISATVFAGSMQFIMISFLKSPIGLLEVGLVTLIVNLRHMVYGISFLEEFKRMGKLKPYMIFTLTDETYALLHSAKPPDNIDKKLFYFFIAFLNHIYWISGSVLGALFGSMLSFNSKGVDFAMVALFAVICTEQWTSFSTHWPALIGGLATLLSLLVFGPDRLLIPAIFIIITLLLMTKPGLEKKIQENSEGE
ncbi:MAG: branched-chain amino acid ABC transporter permease [Peptococcaceae bacterium]|nr:branched-chain amino acid ABC transporter permease [Peptococcaceae bacterium]